MPLIIYCGPGSEQMGFETAGLLGLEAALVEHRTFPDGESHLRLTRDVEGEDVVLIHSTAPPQDRRLVQLLLILGALRDLGAAEVVLVAPYLTYARQDRRRLEGEAVSASTVIRLLVSLGVSRLITVNVHNPEVFSGSGLELHDISAIPLLAEHYEAEGYGGSFSLSLGKKPVDLEHARAAEAVLGGGCGVLETFRDPTTGRVVLGEKDLGVEGRRVIIFDDVITSGATHLRAVESLREKEAIEVHLACVHSLLDDEGLSLVCEMTDGFVCTDTIQSQSSVVKVAPLIAEAILRG
ncbi:MAG: ribose-phosphate diphosphokinase [Candidatus Bathyarchaeota archaeon]|nr:MAG: ribose-phosphate diphosphokinase [Candidatus Bathyarchaeota archaeon]